MPQPVITTPGGALVTDATQLTFTVDFGEPVLGAATPWLLFNDSGARRVDVVLQVATGLLEVVVYVLEQDAALDFRYACV